MPFVDPYTFRARIQPALVVVLPLGFLMFALLPEHPFFVTAFFALLGAAGGTAVVAQVGRERGRKKEPNLWKSWGGPPTTRLLRHRRQEGDDALAPGLRRQVEEWIGYPLPTKQEEEANPSWADTKYEEAVTSLREATRDTSRFPLVFAENANYGFRRNLWGLKPRGTHRRRARYGLLDAAAANQMGATLARSVVGVFANPDNVAVIRLAVAVADTALAAFWIFWVKPSWVKAVDDAYAIRLMESVQTLRSG